MFEYYEKYVFTDDDLLKDDVILSIEEIYKIYLILYDLIIDLRLILLKKIKDEKIKRVDLYKNMKDCMMKGGRSS